MGFQLQVYNPANGQFRTITDDGFYEANDADARSMTEINGRMFVGAFNQDFVSHLPRREAELWKSGIRPCKWATRCCSSAPRPIWRLRISSLSLCH